MVTVRNRHLHTCHNMCGYAEVTMAWNASPTRCPGCGMTLWTDHDLTRGEATANMERAEEHSRQAGRFRRGR